MHNNKEKKEKEDEKTIIIKKRITTLVFIHIFSSDLQLTVAQACKSVAFNLKISETVSEQ